MQENKVYSNGFHFGIRPDVKTVIYGEYTETICSLTVSYYGVANSLRSGTVDAAQTSETAQHGSEGRRIKP